MSFERFTWRGEPIHDIDGWAKSRGERMVKYRLTVKTVYGDEISTGQMPESFWDNLLRSANHYYEEIQ